MKKQDIIEITAKITGRDTSLFQKDIDDNQEKLAGLLEGKSVLVIGGAGTIGSSFIHEILQFNIAELVVFDLNENGLAELIRDIRNSKYPSNPKIKTYPISFGSDTFKRFLENHNRIDVVANFAALKHVRSEKDIVSIERMFENNVLFNFQLLKLLDVKKPDHFFCVSTDKATNPVNIMGASKKLMEDVLFSFSESLKITTARFANVAFSNGSLLESYINRYAKAQGLVSPKDIKRYFVSKKESGQLCLLTCMLGKHQEIFTPKLQPEEITPFDKTLYEFLNHLNLEPLHCDSDADLLDKCSELDKHLSQGKYPVFVFKSDTTGEKPFEEFYTSDDVLDQESFTGINVIKADGRTYNLDPEIFDEAKNLFNKGISKAEVIQFFVKHVKNFSHTETGKNLDDKI